ncbi:MAG: hypothetical protein H7237_00335 [Alkalinema sp. FL-bin-369]|nr:hypothetical protein [Leptolyngbyaceae cyanobacterium LF-bin-369]
MSSDNPINAPIASVVAYFWLQSLRPLDKSITTQTEYFRPGLTVQVAAIFEMLAPGWLHRTSWLPGPTTKVSVVPKVHTFLGISLEIA